jgi:signal transduction histidine kinase
MQYPAREGAIHAGGFLHRSAHRGKIALMLAAHRLERVSVRAALAIGFTVTLGLWLYTGWEFTDRIDRVRSDATEVAGRYNRAQELLSSVRAQVLLSSVRVRDALLAADPRERRSLRDQVEAQYRVITMALSDYEPVMGSSIEGDRIASLQREVEQFHAISMQVLADAQVGDIQTARDTLNRHIVPRREAALAISDEVQSLNRRAFITQQQDIAEIHRLAEFQSRRRLGFALVIGLGVLLITSLYAGKLESRLRDQFERDARISRELQQTAAKVLNAQEEERRRIARELHDEVGQVLTAIRVELDVAQRAIESSGGDPAILVEAQQISDGALQTVRNLTQLLHPAALDDLGLPAAIDASLRGLQRRHNIRTGLQQVDLPQRLAKDVELAAYRIVQEGITNVAKHAKASRCDVRLTGLTDRLLVEIEDDGVGFVEDIDRPIVARGLGLISIRERAARLGGTFNILSTPGEGTRLIISLPDGGALV